MSWVEAPQIANRATWQPKQGDFPSLSFAACCCRIPACLKRTKGQGREIPGENELLLKNTCHMRTSGTWPCRFARDSLGASRREA